MFGFGKLVKRHKLSVAEEAELRKWSYNTVEKPLNFDPFGHARFAHLFVLYD